MDPFTELSASLREHGGRSSFCINGEFHTYTDLAVALSNIKAWVRSNCGPRTQMVGLVANDDLYTYAAMLALWSEGKAYVPIAPENPIDRNANILAQAGVEALLSTSDVPSMGSVPLIRTDLLPIAPLDTSFATCPEHQPAYLLFTSGTTGQPKGVPITRANVAAFVAAFRALGVPVSAEDRCLQMFELTFDLSVMSFLIPLLAGACVYTIPKNEIKYTYAAELLMEQKLTIALMVPSIINYLRPYFDEVDCPELKHSLFCGEALMLDVTDEWSRCVPNARILNVYGPTEHTIFCTHYVYKREGNNKERNGILSIGRPMQGTSVAVIDADLNVLPPGGEGELCLAGPQLTPGYWNDPARNSVAFFHSGTNGRETRFYRTGDLCRTDTDGDILYLGRIDQQTKIQGYRVELSEIEHHARIFLDRTNAVAVPVKNRLGNTEIALAIESDPSDTRELLGYLKQKLPAYMVPTRLKHVARFPLNTNGKTDRKAIERIFTAAS